MAAGCPPEPVAVLEPAADGAAEGVLVGAAELSAAVVLGGIGPLDDRSLSVPTGVIGALPAAPSGCRSPLPPEFPQLASMPNDKANDRARKALVDAKFDARGSRCTHGSRLGARDSAQKSRPCPLVVCRTAVTAGEVTAPRAAR